MRASTGKMGAKKATFIKVVIAKTTRIIKRLRKIISIKEESRMTRVRISEKTKRPTNRLRKK